MFLKLRILRWEENAKCYCWKYDEGFVVWKNKKFILHVYLEKTFLPKWLKNMKVFGAGSIVLAMYLPYPYWVFENKGMYF